MGDKERLLQPLRPVGGKPTPEALARQDRRWRPRYLMLAPHRLGFFLAMVLLIASGAWWALVQAAQVAELNLLNPQRGMPNYQYFVTDIPLRFQTIGERFLGRSIRQLEMVKLG